MESPCIRCQGPWSLLLSKPGFKKENNLTNLNNCSFLRNLGNGNP